MYLGNIELIFIFSLVVLIFSSLFPVNRGKQSSRKTALLNSAIPSRIKTLLLKAYAQLDKAMFIKVRHNKGGSELKE